MPESTREERIARALAMSKSEGDAQEQVVQEETPNQLNREDRIARALKLSQEESKKKSQSQSGSSTEESSSATSETKKEQSSGTTKPVSLEEKKALARKQKLEQMGWKADEETEKSFKGELTKDEKKTQALQKAKSVGETFAPNIEQKTRERETQQGIKSEKVEQAKPEVISERKLRGIPQEDLKALFEGDSELTMFDGGQRIAEKYSLTDDELEKAKQKYLSDKVNEFKKKDLQDSYELLSKYSPAPETFKEAAGFVKQQELLQKAKDMSFDKHEKLSISLMDLDDTQKKTVKEFTDVMDRLNAYREKTFMQKQQGADAQGKGSVVITPKEDAQFAKDAQEFQRLSKEVDKIRGNNNRLFDETAEIISKQTGKKPLTQESFTKKYENDYTKLKSALVDASYKLNYLEKEARSIRDTSREKGRVLTAKQNEALSNLDRERNIAKAEVLALSNALFLNEDVTKKVNRYKEDSYGHEKVFGVVKDLYQGFSSNVLQEFNMTSETELSQARIVNEKLKEIGIDLGVDKELKPTFKEQFGGVLGTSAVLGANIAATSLLTAGAGTLVRGAGMLPKVFAMYDKGGKFKKIADVVISGINFELASDETSFAMGSAEEAAQLVFKKVTGKLKPLNPILEFFTKSLVGATGVTVEEYAGDLFHEFTKTGISQETFDKTFGKTKEEGLEKWSLTFTMGMMSMGKHAKVLMVGSLKEAKAINPEAETTQAMEAVLSEMGIDPDDFIEELNKQVETKSNRAYPDGNGGVLLASNMTEEQELALREKLGIRPLTEEELSLKRIVQQTPDLDADSPYTTKEEMEADLRLLKGEDEGTLPNTYVGESVLTDEGLVTTVTDKVEEGTQLRVPTEQLVTEEAKPVSETFDREKAGVIDVWQDPETNELFVINGTKRVATAMEDGVASVDVNFVKANSLQEAYKIGELKNKLEDTDKTIDAVELVKANPVLKDNLDLSKPKELELFGLTSLNESLTEELKTDPKQAEVLSIIGNSVPIQNQDAVYEVVKRLGLTTEQTAVLVKMPEVKNATLTFVDNKQKALSSVEETTKALDKYEQENDLSIISLKKLFNLNSALDLGAGIEQLQKLARKGNKMGNVKKPSSLKFLPKKITLKHLVRNARDKKSILKEGFNFEKLDNDSNVPGAYFSSEDWSTVGRFGREQENALFVEIENEGLIYFDSGIEFEAFLEENGIDSNKGLSFEEIKPLLDMGVKGILLKEDVVSRQRNELIVIDGSIIKGISETQKEINNLPSSFPSTKSVAQEYHKAKKDGSNPALVEAVESIFIEEQKSDVELKAEVEIKTELSKTGQSNIDALSKDATQLGVEPETLYDRVLSNSPTVKALTEKYAKGVADGLYSTTEATNRLNAEIKENLGKITEEAGLGEAKKEVAQLEEALTSDKKTFTEAMRDIASKVDKLADSIKINPNSTLKTSITFGVEPLIAKAFLKTLSVALKTSATFAEGLQKAVTQFKKDKLLKGKTAKEVNDIITQLTKAATELQRKAELKNPTTKKQQDIIKQSVKAKIIYLNNNSLTTIPSIASIEKLAKREGVIDAKEFAEKLFKEIRRLESEKEKRFNSLDETVKYFLSNKKEDVDALFNQLSDLILKDKQQAVILKNAFIDAMLKHSVKGVTFTQQQITQITKAFESTKLNTLSGIYDLTQKLDQIVNKAVDVTLNNKVTQLQAEITRKKSSLKNIKQNDYIKALLELTPSKIQDEQLKIDLIKTLENVKEYLSGKDNLDYNEITSEQKLEEWQKKIEEYETAKKDALIKAMYEQYKLDNPGTSITDKEYEEFIYPTLEQYEAELKKEEKKIKADEKRELKRTRIEMLTAFNIQEILDFKINPTLSPLTIQIVQKLKDTLKFFVENDHIKDLKLKQLIDINRVYTEMIAFNSFSQAGTLNSELTGIKNAIENQAQMMDKLRTFRNRIKSVMFNPDNRIKGFELTGLHRLIERMFLGQDANSIGSIMFKKLFFGINKAKKQYEGYAKALNKLAKFDLKNKDNFNLGVKAYLLSSPKGLTEVESQLLFELKKEKIRLDIERLKEKSEIESGGVNRATQKAAKQRYELYQEALNDVNQYATFQEYLDAYNNGNLLTVEQSKVYELTKSEYAKIKPELIASNVAFGDKEFLEEDNYTSISYLRMDTGKSEKDVLDPSFNAQAGILDAQSGTVFSRVKNPTNVKEVLDFDFYNVSRNRVLESYMDVFTRGARLELSSFMNSKQFQEVFKNNDDLYNLFKERVGRYANSVLANKRTNLKIDKKYLKVIQNIVTNVKLAYLARTGQVVKQLSIIVHSLSRLDVDFVKGLAVYYGNIFTVDGREKLNRLIEGSDSHNRKALGDEQFAEAIGKLNTAKLTDNYSSLRKINHYLNKFMLDIGNFILSFPDLGLNNATFIGAMIQEQRKQIKSGAQDKIKGFGIDALLINKDTENTYKADRIAGFINNESDTGKQGGMFVNQNLVVQLFYQFKSMAVNAAIGAQNALLDLTDPKATKKDREIALRNLIGFVGSIVAFQISKELLRDLLDDNIKEVAKEVTDRGLEREEDKRKRLIDDLKNPTLWSEYSYRIALRSATDVFAGGVMPSGVSDLLGGFVESYVGNPLYKTVMNKDYEGDMIYWGNWREIQGSVGYFLDYLESASDVVSPYVHTAEEKRKMSNFSIMEAMYDAGKSRPLETTADALYFLSLTGGKGVPSEFLGAMKKVIKTHYKADDNKYERLNPMQKPKKEK